MAAKIPSKFSKGALIGKGTLVGLSVAAAAFEVVSVVNGIYKGDNVPPSNGFTSNEVLVYPYNLPKIDGQDFSIIFQFYQYDRPSILYPPSLKPLGAIALPIPTDMIDSTSLNYSEVKLSDPILGASLENSKKVANDITAGNLADAAQIAAQTVGAQMITKNVGDNLAPVLQMFGLAQNPFLTVLFNSPNFKTYRFTWTFIPENKTDSEKLKNILDKFRYHSLPDIMPNQSGLLLTYPDMVVPVIIPNKYMFDMKQCVLTNVDVNYAPGGTPAFFAGSNAPNAIRLSIQLMEIEYWVKSDLLSSNYHSNKFTSNTGLPSQNKPPTTIIPSSTPSSS